MAHSFYWAKTPIKTGSGEVRKFKILLILYQPYNSLFEIELVVFFVCFATFPC